ncbi:MULTISPECIES: hypothetical protein [unclassified Aureispira]|nr:MULTISPECIES: hypothetical protein [unclassified Aureispira]WMX17018.1 hypothetical protein QP953_11605 [Aureispira sp. CCB-E]
MPFNLVPILGNRSTVIRSLSVKLTILISPRTGGAFKLRKTPKDAWAIQ